MAGIFGRSINSRTDFFAELERARSLLDALVRRIPSDPTFRSVKEQLEKVADWTENGRLPEISERRGLDMSLRMIREFDTSRDDETLLARNLVSQIHNYFEFWPDDQAAADPENPKYLRISALPRS